MDYHLCVDAEQTGLELDEFLCAAFPLLGKRFLRKQVRQGHVLINGQPVVPSQRLRLDEVISIQLDDEDEAVARRPEPAPELPVLYEDERVFVVDKPAALAVEPDRWDSSLPSLIGALTLAAAALGDGAEAEDEEASATSDDGQVPTESSPAAYRPRLVHRLDKDTSGAVLVAKTLEAERHLREAFDGGRVRKEYLALVEGEYPLEDGAEDVIDLPIGPDRKRSGVMRIQDDGKPSRTRLWVERRFRGYTLLGCEPLTGRTHQIRVHLAASGFPLVVDPHYGRLRTLSLSEIKSNYRPKRGRAELPLIARLTLHARSIEFPCVESGAPVRVEAPVPRDLLRVLKQMAKVRAPRRP
jgi:23S rRNA pseudouridine1911/1915/1917 synthase